MATAGGPGPVAGGVARFLADPEVDQAWTSDGELDRLVPLAESLRHWSGVYEWWRHHPLAAVSPDQAPLGPADLSLVDGLRGVHFGQLAALGARFRQAGAAAAQLAESVGFTRSGLTQAWRDGSSWGAVAGFDQLQRYVGDCAERCERLGRQLEAAVVGALAPVVRGAVDEILTHSAGWTQVAGHALRQSWQQRITELRATADVSGEEHREWRAELDAFVTGYDATMGLFRGNLSLAGDTVTRIYQVLRHEIGAGAGEVPGAGAAGPASPFGQVPVRVEGCGSALLGPGSAAGVVPAPTAPASASPAGDDAPSSGSSWAGGSGGAGSTGPAAAPAAGELGGGGPALLGTPSEQVPASGPGGARPASVAGTEPGHGAGIATAGSAGDQQRAGRAWSSGAGTDDTGRAASWERLRALLGEDTGRRQQDGAGR